MAQRIGAGGAFAHFLDHTDDHGLHMHSTSRARRLPVIIHDDYYEYDSDETSSSHLRHHGWDSRHDRDSGIADANWSPKQHQFFVIREGTPSMGEGRRHQQHNQQQRADGLSPEPAPAACFMERTNSGRTILTESDFHPELFESDEFSPEEDKAAAARVKRHMANPRRDVKRHERILRSLIHPKDHKGADFPLDNAALESIFSAADEIFFQGRLSRRVHWEWSSSNQNHYSSRIIGTTALRQAAPPRGGYETLIVLSSPILTDTQYNRRLLISTFLHELVHSYLFICCGFKARHCGGHTDGFKEIAAMIDEWAGRGTLRLCDMEADLGHFREVERSPVVESHHPLYHQHGGVGDSLDRQCDDSSWSSGPRVVFHEQGGAGGGVSWSTGGGATPMSTLSIPMSSASTFVDNGRWGGYDSDEAVPRMLEMAAHTFAGSGVKGRF
ncbi:hypothetical protein VP1G_05471 [Cytospora mali]|uniref:SprT-like domain-containing protein n=1 Tax=Cytospora mali TaxID=578113 RepID=A0A194V2T0_CYTMA|nr:hypothetical protein VP1G_05471 [Valsa mali var. pyri (nom. inval.)]